MTSFTQHTLANGLPVMLREVHSAPVISFWVAYQVGSRNERTGQTGISHWVEHMMFKGTARYPAGVLDREIDRAGGTWNAFTSTDCTMYYATLPADRIDIALSAEADRMINAQFDADETESERQVIINERQGSENSPLFWLMEELRAAAFRVHGYHHDIYGDMVDLEQITREDLIRYYRQHYVPSNAVLVAVGAFETETMLRKLEAHFGTLPAGEKPRLFVRPEPPQQGERKITVEQPGATAFLAIAHRTPPTTADDWFKLDVLNSVMTGSSDGLESRTSRLYRALVKSGVAANVSGDLAETIDPYLYTVTLTLNDGYTHVEAEARLLNEFARLRDDGITERELQRAKKQARASFAYGAESVTNQAFWLAQSAMMDDKHWYDRFLDRIDAVTCADVRDVANRYLIARNRITGYLIPTGYDESDTPR